MLPWLLAYGLIAAIVAGGYALAWAETHDDPFDEGWDHIPLALLVGALWPLSLVAGLLLGLRSRHSP